MSLKSKIEDLKGRTSADPITPSFHGSILDDVARVAEVFDTVADLKAYEDYADGQIVEIKGHTIPGIGGGHFKCKLTPLFSINNVDGYSGTGGGHGNIITMTITALQESLWADLDYGAEIEFENGATASVRTQTFVGNPNDSDRSYPAGVTSIKVVLDGSVDDGEKAFWKHDNGVYVKPDFVGFDNIGRWERILSDQKEVTPQMYGAIPASTPLETMIDSTDAMQKAFWSEFDVIVSGGYFYISSPLEIRRNKNFLSPRSGIHRFSRRGPWHHGRKAGQIYTDQDIDLCVMKTTATVKLNFYCRDIPAHTKAALRLDCTYRIWDADIDITVLGNGNEIDFALDTGTRAFVMDALNAVVTDSSVDVNGSSSGAFHTSTVKVLCRECHTSVHRTQNPLDENKGMSINGIRFDVFSNANLWNYRIETSIANAQFFGEAGAEASYFTEPQPDKPFNLINGRNCMYDGFIWDVGAEGPEEFGHNIATEFVGDIQLIGAGLSAVMRDPSKYRGFNSIKLANKLDGVRGFLPRNNRQHDPLVISRLENALLFIPQKGGAVSADAYQGSGFDFETSLEPATGQASADISISDVSALSQSLTANPMNMSFGATANLDNDFVEIIFDLPPGGSFNFPDGLHVSLGRNFGDDAMPKRIQVITYDGTSRNQEIVNIRHSSHSFRPHVIKDLGKGLFGSNTEQIIIRCIGSDIQDSYSIFDIFSRRAIGPNLPYVHTGGGQTIYGNLNANSFSIREKDYTPGGILGGRPGEKRVKRSLTQSEIANLNSTPITIVSSGDDDTSGGLWLKRAILIRTSGSTEWTNNTVLELRQSFPAAQWATADISGVDSSSERGTVFNFGDFTEKIRPFSGSNIQLRALNGDPSGGDVEFEIIVDFEVI